MGGQQAGRAEQGMSPVMQQSGMMYQQPEAMQQQQQQQAPAAMHTFEGQQLRMLDTPAASAEQEGAAAMASYDNRYSRIASEAYGLRQQVCVGHTYEYEDIYRSMRTHIGVCGRIASEAYAPAGVGHV